MNIDDIRLAFKLGRPIRFNNETRPLTILGISADGMTEIGGFSGAFGKTCFSPIDGPKWIPGPYFLDAEYKSKIFATTRTGMMTIADIRGWGHLTGTGALHLSAEEAVEIQNANAELLSAAPAMYGPLERAIAALKAIASQDGSAGPSMAEALRIVADGEAALKQARGGG